jgi:hypothetical protein
MVPEPKSGFPVSLWAALDRGSPHTPREYHREGIGARQRIFRVFGKNVIIFVFVFIFSGYLKITVVKSRFLPSQRYLGFKTPQCCC